MDDIRAKAAANGHSVKIGVNAFAIARETEAEAKTILKEIIDKADPEAVNAFGHEVKNAGKASPEGEGNWAKSTFEDLVQYNDGFKTNLIGTPQQIAERIVALKAAGVDLVLLASCTSRKRWSTSAVRSSPWCESSKPQAPGLLWRPDPWEPIARPWHSITGRCPMICPHPSLQPR